ncbi:MAG TPA: hypothetical protein VHO70_17565 [Chitinispirillaceae bacterium]|nr:hypothetical protein [Chitinispirillaceae bacterium]
MFYSETTLEGIFLETVFAARTGDITTVSTLLNKGVLLLHEELKKNEYRSEDLKKIIFSLETITMMQEAQNWVALADVLEYEFIQLWKSLTGQ